MRISHLATVTHVDDTLITVSVAGSFACENCKAARTCGLNEGSITLKAPAGVTFAIGQKVKISLKTSTQWISIWWGVVCPTLLLVLLGAGSLAAEIAAGIALIAIILFIFIYFTALYVRLRRVGSASQWRIAPL